MLALPFHAPHEIYAVYGTSLMMAVLRKGIFVLLTELLVVIVLRVSKVILVVQKQKGKKSVSSLKSKRMDHNIELLSCAKSF